MKLKNILIILLGLCLLQSCTKEKCTHVYEGILYTPMYQPMSSLRNVSVQAPKSITENGKIFVKGNFIFLNEVNKGFHIIDNSNPANPRNISFVSVPGNIDLIAKGNYLLVDNYVDLLTFDISNPATIQLVNRKENALPYRRYNYGFSDDSARGIIVGFDKRIEKRENDCSFTGNSWPTDIGIFVLSNSAASSPIKMLGGVNGQTGSLSRFALLNNYLYIAGRNALTPIDVSNPMQPTVKPIVGTSEIETIYPFNNVLFLGGPNGMFIYSVANPSVPTYVSGFNHWRGCDPVVVENNKAYVTVRGGGACGGERNILDIIDVTNITQPRLIKSYAMQNPYGLGIYGSKLGICDGDFGFKLFDATNSNNLQLLTTIQTSKTFDVIMNNTIAMLIGKDGLYQYNISNSNDPILISKIPIVQ